ncbi:UNVERIFIED_CONTAM: hypothetical protein Sradi_5288500 [Sesamum radiatum]|uniref:Uncharacterized protein n=1 Tax=Sesamum radiatum TaxID=300843 RepID=A0AAW2LM99_SESRA
MKVVFQGFPVLLADSKEAELHLLIFSASNKLMQKQRSELLKAPDCTCQQLVEPLLSCLGKSSNENATLDPISIWMQESRIIKARHIFLRVSGAIVFRNDLNPAIHKKFIHHNSFSGGDAMLSLRRAIH